MFRYKLRPIGNKLYLVYRREDGFNTGIVISGCPLVNGKELPWQVRWTDIFSNKHEENFRTRKDAVNFIEGKGGK